MKRSFSFANDWPKLLLGAAAIAFVAMIYDRTFSGSDSSSSGLVSEVRLPADMSALARQGEGFFNQSCAACHGKNGAGTDQGPPLVHDIYNPGHHADEAFLRAVTNGVPQHHWRFGNMPKRDVSMEQLRAIVTYVRELQIANGIATRPHDM